MKTCTKCRKALPVEQFYRRSNNKTGLHYWCKTCFKENAAVSGVSWRKRNPAKIRDKALRSLYGVTNDWYVAKLAEQKGGCAICGGVETSIDKRTGTPRSLAVDHDHETNAVRGLLCGNCNRGIGNLQDEPELMQRAALYIRNSTSTTRYESTKRSAEISPFG